MITAKELRIGNLMNGRHRPYGGDNIEALPVITIDTPYHVSFLKPNSSEQHVDDLQPIPLTEEWLVKFGLKKTVGIEFHEWNLGDWGIIQNDKFEGYPYLVEFKYVHQLQNWWHALTGEELKIKDEQ